MSRSCTERFQPFSLIKVPYCMPASCCAFLPKYLAADRAAMRGSLNLVDVRGNAGALPWRYGWRISVPERTRLVSVHTTKIRFWSTM
jgi:hypothetical protein